jgi:spindle assembly abnormal protein 6
MEELDRENPLYESCVPVKIIAPEREDRVQNLTIRIISGCKVGTAAKDKLLHIELTDDADPFFLYTLDVTEEQFHDLKHDQCLLVYFNGFPDKFIELIECVNGGEGGREEEREAQSSRAKFMAILNIKDAPLDPRVSIVETNRFKHLTHISLHFRAGNDSTIKTYLAARFTQLKQIHERSIARINDQNDYIAKVDDEVERLKSWQSSAEMNKAKAVSELEGKHRMELAEMRETTMTAIQKARDESNHEIRLSNERSSKNESLLNKKIDELEKQNLTLTDMRNRLENKERELSARVSSLDEQLTAASNELFVARGVNRDLDALKFNNEKELTKLQLRIAAMEQQLKDKEEVIAKMTDLLDNSKGHQNNLEESIALYKGQHTQLTSKLESSIAEINRGNSIIQKLQSDYRNARAKIKLKSNVLKQQEQLLDDRRRAAEELQRKLSQCERQCDKLENDLRSKSEEMRDMTDRLSASNQLLEQNQQVITYLNKEMNEIQLGRKITATPSSGYVFRPSSDYHGTPISDSHSMKHTPFAFSNMTAPLSS